MSDIDVVEKVLTDQPDLPVHIPYAGNTSPGIASFNTRDFIVEENGAVQLSKDVQALTDEAIQAAENAKQSEQNAAESETNAQQSEQNAQQSASRAAASATNAKSSETQAQTHLQQVLATEIRINNTEDDIEQIAEQVSNDRIEVENLRVEYTEYVTYVESQASMAAEMAEDAQSSSINANIYKQQAQDAWLQARSEADRAQQISDSIGATFKPKGTIKFEELPAQPSVEYEGFLWDISNSFMTDDRFTVGAGQYVPAGSDVSCIETTDGVYKYNISAGLYDLSAYVTKTQLDLETEAREAADNNLSTRIDAKYTKPLSGIPDTDLSTDIKNSLGKANTAYQKPSSGIPKSDLASTVQSSLGKADTAYQKPAEGIAKTDLASAVQISLNKADSALQSVPVATPSTLGGVKPVAKTDDMTQSVGVDASGALWVESSEIPNNSITEEKLSEDVKQSLGKADTAYQKPSSGIPESDLSAAVQSSLGKADTAYQKPSGGILKTDLASAVQASLGKADTAYQKPSTGIPKGDLESSVQTSLSKADSALQSIPIATPSVVGGVKPVTKTSEMTQEVGVDSNGALWTKEASGGTTVVANPTATGTQNLTSLQVGGTVYNIPQGGAVEYATDEEIDALFEAAEPQDELIGTWVFNDTINSENTFSFSFSFTCNDILYKGIQLDKGRLGEEMYYIDTNDDMTLVYNVRGTWSGTAYKTIQITDVSALTNREKFTTWLKANATKQ